MKLSLRFLADYVKKLHQKLFRTRSSIIFPYSNNQIIYLWRSRCRSRRRFWNSLLRTTTETTTPQNKRAIGRTRKMGVLHVRHVLYNNPVPSSAKQQCEINACLTTIWPCNTKYFILWIYFSCAPLQSSSNALRKHCRMRIKQGNRKCLFSAADFLGFVPSLLKIPNVNLFSYFLTNKMHW